MKKRNTALAMLAAVSALGCGSAAAQQALTQDQCAKVQTVVASELPSKMGIGKLKAQKVALSGDTIVVDLSNNFADIPFTQQSVAKLKSGIRNAVGTGYSNYNVKLTIDGNDIDKYFIDFEPAYKRSHSAFVTDMNPNRHYRKGLDGNIIAIWQSHGWYFEPKLNRWEWQRAHMFQTVEDMYTQSYVIPFLNPMLENAGAYVWDPRDRDTSPIEVIVDADGGKAQTGYRDAGKWKQGSGTGFAYKRDVYKDFENPFVEGTYRQSDAERDLKKAAVASFDAAMPAPGSYAVYISYKSLPNSVKDALVTVNSLDGKREMKIDQTMAGGVWVFLGYFKLDKGLNKDLVTVSNFSKQKGGVVTVDAIKVGGGMGNIARRPAARTPENIKLAGSNTQYLQQEGVDYDYVTSRRMRFTEGARYFLQWSGFPDSVYSPTGGINDYNDDYCCRAEWVNYLAGGSQALPGRQGLNLPVDLSFAFHTDAGTTMNDDIIGSLGIYCTKQNGKKFGKYANGTPRELSRNFTNMVLSEIVNDVRAKFEPNWTRRGMWDASYYEARVPEVPAMLLELLSHQNFADMKYGLDPNFRFTVSRAVYKGMLKFIASRDHRDYEVQPLPVNSFAISQVSDKNFVLTWKPTHDDLSDNADAKKYLVLERVGRKNGFKEVAVVKEPKYVASVNDNEVHSYQIVAMNDGGRSFPSEVLSLGVAPNSKGSVMVVNGFTRISAPDWFDSGEMAGFDDNKDHGVPYIQQINYIGPQFEFRRKLPWRDDDASGFGDSRSTYETQTVAGNTFDYPSIHGESILKAGYSFVSSSVKAVEDSIVRLGQFSTVDLILGKQKETLNGRGYYPNRYKAFTPALRRAIEAFTGAGGNLLVSGAYVASDIWDRDSVNADEVRFAEKVLGYTYLKGQAAVDGDVYTVANRFPQIPAGKGLSFVQKLNSAVYAVESPDAIKASDAAGATIMRYRESNIPAAIASQRSGYRTVVLGFPIEVIGSSAQRDGVIGSALNFFNEK